MRHSDVNHVSVSVTGPRQQGDRTFHVMCNSSTNSNMIIGNRNCFNYLHTLAAESKEILKLDYKIY